MSDTPQVLLAHHLKALRLPTFLREYDKLARQCAAEGVDHSRYLLRLAELEMIDRERRTGVDPVSWSVFGRKARRRAMPKTHPPYPAEYRRRMVEQVRAGRSLKELAREFEPSVESIRQWVRQAQLDHGRAQRRTDQQ